MRFIPNPLAAKAMSSGLVSDVNEGLEEKADAILEEAQSVVPVATGTLRDSLKAEVGVESGTIRGRVSSDVEYAPFVEFGTATQEPQPFLRQALDSQR